MSQGIIYSCISLGPVVLVEHASKEGNFVTLANMILSKAEQTDHRKSFKDKSGNYVYNYETKEGITYLCFSSNDLKTGVTFGFLDEIRKKFTSVYEKNQIQSAVAYDPRFAGFKATLSREMERFGNKDSVDSQIVDINKKIETTKNVMIDNVNKVIERGDDVDTLLNETDVMVVDAEDFRGNAQKVNI